MTIRAAPMASGASALALSTLAAMVNRKMNVPMSSTAYFRPAVGAEGTTSAAAGEASGAASVCLMMSMTVRVVPPRAPVVRANAHLRTRPAGHLTYPPAATHLHTAESLIAASRNDRLQPTASAEGRWRGRIKMHARPLSRHDRAVNVGRGPVTGAP